ncbi:MAG: pyrroline-5-carboxylate reductase [Desulfobulbus sp.]|nr:MAG: pyrroline-5-carboxylate reductase [Desulfobulbus sp.]RUM37019.1 MAG: pyrroline-5-carboxylate reductase [Desulfobulbus sp.]
MKVRESIGMVGGGQMGEALVRGLIQSGLAEPGNITVAEPFAERREYLAATYSVQVTDDSGDLAANSKVIILAVKPQIMDIVLQQYSAVITPEHLVLSIAAGVTIKQLEKGLGGSIPLIRVMPNTPALVLAGASALSGNAKTTPEDIQRGLKIFSAVGTCVEVPENLLDAVTGLSGSGPGYVFTFIEAMIDGGVLAGLPRPIAEQLVLQTVYGSAKLGLETGEAPAVLKGRVTSPGGTTITGLQVLEEAGLRGAVMTAVAAATDKSRALGK